MPAASLVESSSSDVEAKAQSCPAWEDDPENPLHWPTGKKVVQFLMLCTASFLVSVATSIISPSIFEIMTEFSVSRTVAILTVSLYVLALGFGPVIGGPASETIGRQPVYVSSLLLTGLFTLGAGLTHSFAGLCILRFLAGMSAGPVLAVAAGTLIEMYPVETRGPPMALFILIPFLAPGLGPVIGAFVTTRKGWRWNMWTLLFLTAASLVLTLFCSETFGPEVRRRLAKKRGQPSTEARPTVSQQLHHFVVVALIRPLHMTFIEPLTALVCLYVACGFGILYSFFAAVPYIFITIYDFSLEECGLIFLSVVIGCVLGLVCILLCDVLLYRPQVARHAPLPVPQEHRLYPAMFGSVGLPLGLFWMAWTARTGVSWISPATALIPFSAGNLCIFVGSMQYLADVYDASVVASAASANSFARYTFAAAFPLFIVQMYQSLGIEWAGSFWGFLSLLLLPIPWALFKYGPSLRARSVYNKP